jgi:hypothetical protein
MSLDVASINTWAFWDFKRKPYYTVYRLAYFTGEPHNLYIFKQRRGNHTFGLSTSQILAHVAAGSFKPFLLVNESPPEQFFRPMGAGA